MGRPSEGAGGRPPGAHRMASWPGFPLPGAGLPARAAGASGSWAGRERSRVWSGEPGWSQLLQFASGDAVDDLGGHEPADRGGEGDPGVPTGSPLADQLRHDAPALAWVGTSRRVRWLLQDFPARRVDRWRCAARPGHPPHRRPLRLRHQRPPEAPAACGTSPGGSSTASGSGAAPTGAPSRRSARPTPRRWPPGGPPTSPTTPPADTQRRPRPDRRRPTGRLGWCSIRRGRGQPAVGGTGGSRPRFLMRGLRVGGATGHARSTDGQSCGVWYSSRPATVISVSTR